ncbi:hypothetical protein OUZ56_011491 [Daphnia magna]|uniref:Uncharacterized protein n=1 Tax=Daphnia magna TaxID=35525 RepID=A0ABQ9Z0A8_9CRUS|nr:hypothetical protein OUZ56_011491 [Daphnia magna]
MHTNSQHEAKNTDACLGFTPFVGEVWKLGDFYYNMYPGYAKYRDLYSRNYVRLLWWLESGEDVYHPTPRRSDFYPELRLGCKLAWLRYKFWIPGRKMRKLKSYEFLGSACGLRVVG